MSGQLVEQWPLKKLGDCLEIQNGYAFASKQFDADLGMQLIRIRDLKNGTTTQVKFQGEYDQKFVVNKGDLLIGMDGEFVCYEWKGEPSLLNQRVCRLQNFSSELLPRFVYYGINKYLKEIEDNTSYTTVKHLSGKKIKDIDFPIPPLEEQQRIVSILDEAFDNIKHNISQMETKLQNAKDLFRSKLTNFFNSPEPDWSSTTLGEQFVLQRGFDITKKQQNEGLFPVVSSGGIRSYHDTAKVQAPGVVVGRKGSIGSVYYLEVDFWPHDTTLWIKDFCGNNPKLVYYYLQSLDLKQYDSGSANPALNRNNLHPLRINWPPVNKQESITNLLDSLFLETVELERIYHASLNILSELKQSILQEAFNGTLQIAEGLADQS